MAKKTAWSGIVVGVQPRIRLTRSFDQRQHSYLGYVLRVARGDETGAELTIGIGKGAQAKHAFRAGDGVEGVGTPPADGRIETVDLYKVSGIRVLSRATESEDGAAPYRALAPELPVYRERGHRRLSVRTYAAKCHACIWGCEMPVEMIIDQWNPRVRRYRRETFCYGPKSCPIYRAGPTRKVPGRGGMSWEEEDWVDEEATSHRGPDE